MSNLPRTAAGASREAISAGRGSSDMAKKSTRRSVSIKGTTYHRLKGYCDATGVSVSGLVEVLIASRLEAAGVPEFRAEDIPVPRELPATTAIEPAPGQHFTF